MKKKLIIGAFLALLAAPADANKNALSKQELLEQFEAKENEWNILVQKIMDQEAKMLLKSQKIYEFRRRAKDAIKQKLLKENPQQQINEIDIEKIFMDELKRFSSQFYAKDSKSRFQIHKNTFFNEFLDPEDSLTFKFYAISKAYEIPKFEKMIIEWESVYRELIELEDQINAIEIL